MHENFDSPKCQKSGFPNEKYHLLSQRGHFTPKKQ